MLKIRRIVPALMMVGVVALSGCVYLRLLQFKKQFRDFHENFEFSSDGHYSLIIKNPLLSGDDVDFVMKAMPTRVESLDGEIISRYYAFNLESKSAGPGSLLEYELQFGGDLFREMHFPPEFSDLFREGALIALLTSLGEAEANRKTENLRVELRQEKIRQLMPDKRRVLEALGKPSSQWQEKDGLDRLLYRYDLDTRSSNLKPHQKRAFGRFHFEGETLRKVDASFGGHVFSFEIP
jgi:hypothetical protein